MDTKPKYNIVQNVAWMIGNAWQVRKRVLLFVVLSASLNVGMNLLQLFVAPDILHRVEIMAPLPELIGTIVLFALGIFLVSGLRQYEKGAVPHL